MRTRSDPIFSVCIPAYNDAVSFARCLSSVLRQIGQDIECVVSDDSTTDDICHYVQDHGGGRVRYVRNSPPLGAPANWNAALALAKGDIVTLLHQDDWYLSDHALDTIRKTMEESGADVLAAGRALYSGGRCLGEYPDPSGAVSRFLEDFPAGSLVVNRLGHPGVFFFRRSLSSIRYDEALLYFSDTEYYQRLLSAAGRTETLPEPLVALERGAAGQLSAACLKRPELLVDELIYALKKHHAGPVARGFACGRLLASNLRLLPSGVLWPMFRRMRANLFGPGLAALIACVPFFCAHMLYRLLYRRMTGKPWG